MTESLQDHREILMMYLGKFKKQEVDKYNGAQSRQKDPPPMFGNIAINAALSVV
jgi:hypothetical protein